ncbi:hypothetical protein IJG14_00400 [bacterium]|nr:hypothetical protein [bacterium]
MFSECQQIGQYYEDILNTNKYKKINNLAIYDNESCYCKMYDLLTPNLLIYKVYSERKELDFVKLTIENYIIPTLIINKSDIYINISDDSGDMTLGRKIESTYNKPFVMLYYNKNIIQNKKPLIKITSNVLNGKNNILSKFQYDSFEQIMNEIAQNKKMLLTININHEPYDIVSLILKYSDQITGFSIQLHANNSRSLADIYNLTQKFNENFILVHRNCNHYECIIDSKCKYTGKNIFTTIFLTYINKNLVDKKYLPFKQDYSKDEDYKKPFEQYGFIPEYKIDWRVILYEKLKDMFDKND